MISNTLEKKTIRLDIYLYYIRIFKSRSIATKFVLTNRLRISGHVIQKPHKMICIGDVLTMTINNNIKIFPKTISPLDVVIIPSISKLSLIHI